MLLYARTARHLRWRQLWYRPVRAAQGKLPVRVPPYGAVHAAVPGERRCALAREVAGWGAPRAGYRQRAEQVLAGRFEFLNHAEQFSAIDWRARHVSHLWNYNLHYFDYAMDVAWAWRETREARYADRFTELALAWIDGTDPGRSDGWEPYAVSLRTVNWIQALLLLEDAVAPADRHRLEGSLARQLAYLARRLEWHILANHLLKNLKALVVGGLYFRGEAAERWLRDGRRLLWAQVLEQVLLDGTHYERSPMYHAIALGDVLEVVSLLHAVGEDVPGEVLERTRGMVAAAAVLSRPDGSLHLFNDAANGIAPDGPWLDAMARRALGTGIPRLEGPMALPEAGYYGHVDSAAGARLLVDCGAPGPLYQPGHAHCDLLSFELDVDGRPLVVDSGVSGYGEDPLREYVRSTRAHNTVMIDGREQSELWSTFRMARRAKVLGASTRSEDGVYTFTGAYTPYHDGRAVHTRRIEARRGRWLISDRVDGAADRRLAAFLHLHPDWVAERQGDQLLARCAEAAVVVEPFGVDEWKLAAGEDPRGWYCPAFGVATPAPTLELSVRRNHAQEFGCTIRRVDA